LTTKWKILVPAALIVLAAVLIYIRTTNASATPEGRRGAAPVVRVGMPTLATFVSRLQLNGDVLPLRQAAIYSKVSGTLERNFVDMGSAVPAGELLATIDSTELVQQVLQTSATYQNARETYARLVQLFEKTLASRQDLDNGEAAMKVAEANYNTAKTRLGYARITAPFSGIVTRRFLDPGALVNATSSTLFTLMNLDTVRIIVNVPEKDVVKIYGINEAQVTLDALPGRMFKGRVTRFSQAVDLTTRTMPIEVRVGNPGAGIKPGMFASIGLVLASRPNTLTLPSNVILRDENGTFVFIVSGQNAKRVRITVGPEQESQVEILSGLRAEDSVIVAGQQFVRDGGAVALK
jgi:membrane fusion protein (multidrug efflux system)